ncbi:unnamed protein product [Nippostrongylus brasiliensis]|uniref:Glucosylceramidase n=1 Tax=Nippostrongylus brasiliensis TaxID=27835 RepID=A0A0N4YDD3_NIPBR|nr:unnamed protein product [Nippostrongylus brasiliensis]
MKTKQMRKIYNFFAAKDFKYQPCAARSFGENLVVCVCNRTYCDNIEPIGDIQKGETIQYLSDQTGKRLVRSKLSPEAKSRGINVFYQGCDFSTREYSYAETPGDFALASFNLTEEDFLYKIPFIVQAQLLSGNKTRFFASPWSAPGWMKTNGRMKGGGRLRGDEDGPYYKAWANYFIRFFGEYHRNGVDFWGMTIQNEPEAGLDPNWGWQAMYFNARMERNFVKNLLGPALKSRSYTKNIKLMINDDQRITLPEWADTVLNDTEAAKYVSGIAIHWYTDKIKPASVLTTTHDRHPNHFILGTEACTGYLPGEHKPLLGNWTRAEEYLTDIIEDLSNWVVGWTDWNLCLDMKGGPNWVGNFVDAPVIVDAAKQEYYKQPMWYAMAHIRYAIYFTAKGGELPKGKK